MLIKKLPLADSPIVGYMMYSYHLAVTFAHINPLPWFYTNYVQLQCNPKQLDLSDFLMDFDIPQHMTKGEVHFTEGTARYNPWLRSSPQLTEELLAASNGRLSEFAIEGIKNDRYIETYVDEFFISALFNGGATHFRHRLLIFGFDESSGNFDILGFDKKSQFHQLKCSRAELDNAFEGADPHSFLNRTSLFDPNLSEIPENTFHAGRFKTLVLDYLEERNTLLNPDLRNSPKDAKEFWFGTKTYGFLQDYLLNSIKLRRSGGNNGLDFRGFHILWEHKKCMLDRLHWLQASGHDISNAVLTEYQQVVRLVELARSHVLMVRFGLLPPEKNRLLEVPALLQKAKSIEVSVLGPLLEKI